MLEMTEQLSAVSEQRRQAVQEVADLKTNLMSATDASAKMEQQLTAVQQVWMPI